MHVSDFVTGKQSDVLTALNWYKAWETGGITALSNALPINYHTFC
jgi:hypothetical protein